MWIRTCWGHRGPGGTAGSNVPTCPTALDRPSLLRRANRGTVITKPRPPQVGSCSLGNECAFPRPLISFLSLSSPCSVSRAARCLEILFVSPWSRGKDKVNAVSPVSLCFRLRGSIIYFTPAATPPFSGSHLSIFGWRWESFIHVRLFGFFLSVAQPRKINLPLLTF